VISPLWFVPLGVGALGALALTAVTARLRRETATVLAARDDLRRAAAAARRGR